MNLKSWNNVLDDIGWPTKAIVLDFETYFDTKYSLSKMSTIEYIKDSRFEILGLAARWVDGAHKFHWGSDVSEYISTLQKMFYDDLRGVTIVVANDKFDISILYHKFGIIPPHVVDIQNLSRQQNARAKHHVRNLADRYGLPCKGDTGKFLAKHLSDFEKDLPARLEMEEYANRDAQIEAGVFMKLMPLVSWPEVELPLAQLTLEQYVSPGIMVDYKKASLVKRELLEGMYAKIVKTGHTKTELNGNKKFPDILRGLLPDNEKIPMKQGKNGMIPALSKSDPEVDSLKFHKDDKVCDLIEARLAVKSRPLHIKRIDNIVNQAKVRDGWFGIPLKYHGAHTGRWSGCERVNAQNLGSREDGLVNSIKHILVAPPGEVLIIGDLAQIEARMLAYLAGESALVKGFQQGHDVYSEFASELFQTDVRKHTDDDSPELQKELKFKRYVGKQSILGLGYGMGSTRFLEQLKAYKDARKLIQEGKINLRFADDVVDFYRKKYKQIPKFWGFMENNFKRVTKYPENDICSESGIKFYHKQGTTFVELPSTRRLRYPKSRIKVSSGQIHYFDGRATNNIWGGTLTENLVQAASRDVIAEQVLIMKNRKYKVVLTVHDSVVVSVPDEIETESLEDMRGIMELRPKWCSGLPLSVDIESSRYYK